MPGSAWDALPPRASNPSLQPGTAPATQGCLCRLLSPREPHKSAGSSLGPRLLGLGSPRTQLPPVQASSSRLWGEPGMRHPQGCSARPRQRSRGHAVKRGVSNGTDPGCAALPAATARGPAEFTAAGDRQGRRHGKVTATEWPGLQNRSSHSASESGPAPASASSSTGRLGPVQRWPEAVPTWSPAGGPYLHFLFLLAFSLFSDVRSSTPPLPVSCLQHSATEHTALPGCA